MRAKGLMVTLGQDFPVVWGTIHPMINNLNGIDLAAAKRFMVISAINVGIHQVVLFVGHRVIGWDATIANVVAAVVTAVPAYLMSRYWVWQVKGKNNLKAEVLPFVLVTLLGLVVSTLSVWLARSSFDSAILIGLAAIVGYIIVWILKFTLLDRIFKRALESYYQITDCWPTEGNSVPVGGDNETS